MDNFVNLFIMGKKYSVPASATIMGALEYAGYRLVRGCGCRHGFCGACASVYRIKGKREIKVALACQTQVENDMYLAMLPFFPVMKQNFDIATTKPDTRVMMSLYPEIYSCLGCNSCTKGCPQELSTMQYIAHAKRAEFGKCAHLSFDCVMCGICSSRCPAGISHPQVALLARRLYGRYIAKPSEYLQKRVCDIENGLYDSGLDEIMATDDSEIRKQYNNRDIEG